MIFAPAAPCHRPRIRGFSGLVAACLGLLAVSPPGAMRADAAGSQFPLAHEPLLYETTLTAPDGALFFGGHVAMDGDTAAISGGQIGNERVYVFVRSNGSWVAQATLEPPAGPQFNVSAFGVVALSGNTILVGAPTADINGEGGGAAYVFERSGTTWSGPVTLAPLDRYSNYRFGQDVALDGSTAIVGATGADAAYVFVKSGGSWRQQAKFSSGVRHNGFGTSVAVHGDIAVIGAPQDNYGANTSQGSAYIFTRSGSSWSSSPKRVTGSDATAKSQFGSDVAIDGDTILVGAANARAAYVFTGAGVVERAKLTAPEANQFGYSLALRDGRAIVGGLFENPSSSNYQGAAYVFEGSGTSWVQTNRLTQPPPTPNHGQTYRVAFDGKTALLGSSNFRTGTGPGQVFVYSSGAPPPPPPAQPRPPALTSTVNGLTVTLSWTPSALGTAPTSYIVEAGTSPGTSNMFNGNVGPGTTLTASVGAGTYYVRVRAANEAGTSAPSNELALAVGGAPGQPTITSAVAAGGMLNVAWSPGAGSSATGHRLDFYSGASVVASVNAGAATSVAIPIPAGTQGTFDVRVTAANGAVAGPPSLPMTFTIGAGCSPPASPTLGGAVVNGTASVNWPAVAGAASYVLSAGTTPGGTQYMAPTNLGSSTGASASGLPAGFTAWVRVFAVNACGQQSAAADFLVQ